MKIGAAIGSALLLACLTACGEGCGSCACGLPYCGDLAVSYLDNGKAFNLEVGQSVVGQLFDESTPTYVRSSDPAVMKQVGKSASESVNGQKLLSSGFVAAKAGFARLEFGYTQCTTDVTVTAILTAPCSYHVDVNVIQFPRTEGTVQMHAQGQATAKLRSGQVLRVVVDVRLLGPDQYLRFRIVPTGIVEWAITPITLAHGMEGAVRAVSPGTARLAADLCNAKAIPGVVGSCTNDVTGPGGQVESFEDLIVVVAR